MTNRTRITQVEENRHELSEILASTAAVIQYHSEVAKCIDVENWQLYIYIYPGWRVNSDSRIIYCVSIYHLRCDLIKLADFSCITLRRRACGDENVWDRSVCSIQREMDAIRQLVSKSWSGKCNRAFIHYNLLRRRWRASAVLGIGLSRRMHRAWAGHGENREIIVRFVAI